MTLLPLLSFVDCSNCFFIEDLHPISILQDDSQDEYDRVSSFDELSPTLFPNSPDQSKLDNIDEITKFEVQNDFEMIDDNKLVNHCEFGMIEANKLAIQNDFGNIEDNKLANHSETNFDQFTPLILTNKTQSPPSNHYLFIFNNPSSYMSNIPSKHQDNLQTIRKWNFKQKPFKNTQKNCGKSVTNL